MKLSLCLAVYNEEKNLHYPLDSAIDFVDEVIIVDGGSIDRTIEVAKSYGKKIKVINSDNPIMFHKNKQKAIEELTAELKEEIKSIVWTNFNSSDKRAIQESPLQYVAYNLPRKNWFLTGFLMKGGQYPDYTIRLYKNGLAKFPCKDVHENVEILGKIGFLKNALVHYADPDFSRYLSRWDRYTTAEADRIPIDTKLSFFNYFIWKPKITFLMMYFRHKGFMDGFPGFVFALFSSIRFWVIYIKWSVKK